jgi:hypothetical protein
MDLVIALGVLERALLTVRLVYAGFSFVDVVIELFIYALQVYCTRCAFTQSAARVVHRQLAPKMRRFMFFI